MIGSVQSIENHRSFLHLMTQFEVGNNYRMADKTIEYIESSLWATPLASDEH